jgi:protein-S-isoprenylcysteine O-methyltransferase Ste14
VILVLIAAGLLGGSSLLALTAFLYLGSLHLVDLHLGEAAGLLLDAGLCLLFFVQHSGMVRQGYRRRLARFVDPAYHPALYSITSGLALLVLLVLWQGSDHTLAAPGGVVRWLLRAAFVFSIAGFLWGMRAVGPVDTFGIRSGLEARRGGRPPDVPFTVRGPYRWVRHPLYLFSLVMIWSCPDLTADRLLFNVLWTVWIVVGTILEERDLVATFGEEYRDYQRRVPMLLPIRLGPFRSPW